MTRHFSIKPQGLRVFVRTGMSLCAAGGFALAQPRVASAGPQDSRVDGAGVGMIVAQAPDRPVKTFRVPHGVRVVPAPAPILNQVEATADGYALVGSGFGTDRGKVQIFEGNTEVPSAAVISVSNDRIVARSRTTGPVDHKVVVAGRPSNIVSFTHARLPAALRSRRALELPRFQPKTITVGELTMTGPRFLERKAITTGGLTMTGPRFLAHVGVTTGELTMTGPRFLERKAITTGGLSMTGPR